MLGSLFNKADGWRHAALLERDSTIGVSSFCEVCRIFLTAFLHNTSWWTLLVTSGLFLLFADQWSLQPKDNLFGGFQCYIKKRNSQAPWILWNYDNQSGRYFTYLVVTTPSKKKKMICSVTFIICKGY